MYQQAAVLTLLYEHNAYTCYTSPTEVACYTHTAFIRYTQQLSVLAAVAVVVVAVAIVVTLAVAVAVAVHLQQ
jgi:hypothetical protein